MLNKIKQGWNLSRIAFTTLGTLVVIQAVLEKQWIGIPFGLYFMIMGIFALGCASGSCHVPFNKPDNDSGEVEFEEIKQHKS